MLRKQHEIIFQQKKAATNKIKEVNKKKGKSYEIIYMDRWNESDLRVKQEKGKNQQAEKAKQTNKKE